MSLSFNDRYFVSPREAKIIFCWREPVSRAWSMYKFKSSIAGREEYGKTLKEIYQLEMKWINNGEMWAQMKSAAADLDGFRGNMWQLKN